MEIRILKTGVVISFKIVHLHRNLLAMLSQGLY